MGVSLTRMAIEAVLGESFAWDPHVQPEFAYDMNLPLVVIRVLSGIPRFQRIERPVIRILVLQAATRQVMVAFRVPVDKRWEFNLRDRLNQLYEEVRGIRYCDCGGLRFRQRGPYGVFIACSTCKYRQAVNMAISTGFASPTPISGR